MPIPREIKVFLDSHHVDYEHLTHAQVFTTPEVAETQHVSGKEVAKTVMVMADHQLVMAVVPANPRLDVEKLGQLLGASSVRLAEEEEFEKVFPGCEPGAMPPFGNLYQLPVWLDVSFTEQPEILLNAGTHTDSLRMRYQDFERLVEPSIASLTEV